MYFFRFLLCIRQFLFCLCSSSTSTSSLSIFSSPLTVNYSRNSVLFFLLLLCCFLVSSFFSSFVPTFPLPSHSLLLVHTSCIYTIPFLLPYIVNLTLFLFLSSSSSS